MPAYFVDTWYFVARLDRADVHHLRAQRLGARLTNEHLVTHDAVLTEVLAYFSGYGPGARTEAVGIVRRVVFDFEVVPASRTLFTAGLDRYAARPDKEWSHVDCMSMVLMESLGIHHVLTNDHHFAQAGFTVVNQ
ncbi:MAG: type II toxin-antitoxin system VapC family toxin [Thermoanaerobaculia bacterium]